MVSLFLHRKKNSVEFHIIFFMEGYFQAVFYLPKFVFEWKSCIQMCQVYIRLVMVYKNLLGQLVWKVLLYMCCFY